VLADLLLESGDPKGEWIAVFLAAGYTTVECPSNSEVEAQRLMRASHAPATCCASRMAAGGDGAGTPSTVTPIALDLRSSTARAPRGSALALCCTGASGK
jgi:hypothetical protein